MAYLSSVMILNSVSVLYCRAVVPGQVLAANVFTENVRVWNALICDCCSLL